MHNLQNCSFSLFRLRRSAKCAMWLPPPSDFCPRRWDACFVDRWCIPKECHPFLSLVHFHYHSLLHRFSFFVSSHLDLIPQLLNTYMGTTLRSMEDVMAGKSNNSIVLFAQVIIALAVSYLVNVRMKHEVHTVWSPGSLLVHAYVYVCMGCIIYIYIFCMYVYVYLYVYMTSKVLQSIFVFGQQVFPISNAFDVCG